MSVIAILTLIFAVGMPFSVLPHVWRMIREKSSLGQSMWTPILCIMGSTVWLFYGIEIKDGIVIFTNCLWLLSNFIYLSVILFYRKHIKNV